MKKFKFGKFSYEYELVKQDRKTLSLTVTPELEIILHSPKYAENERIENFLKRKWFWLEKQLSYFKKYQRKTYKREFISGEGIMYLGRQYKLIVNKGKNDSVSITHSKFIISTTKSTLNSVFNEKLIDSWFKDKTCLIFQNRFSEVLTRFDYINSPKLQIRDMKRRWGSYLQDKIFLNPKLIHASKDCIDYVIAHELCHLKYKDHNSRFWKLLDEKYPKWERVKEKLETLGTRL